MNACIKPFQGFTTFSWLLESYGEEIVVAPRGKILPQIARLSIAKISGLAGRCWVHFRKRRGLFEVYLPKFWEAEKSW